MTVGTIDVTIGAITAAGTIAAMMTAATTTAATIAVRPCHTSIAAGGTSGTTIVTAMRLRRAATATTAPIPVTWCWPHSRPAFWRSLAEAGVEAQFGTLGAPGRRLDDQYAADGNPSEYRQLFDEGAVIIATDTPLTVKSVLAAQVVVAERCAR